MIKPHTFHIPVMGIGYTIDTPIKVSNYGIDSVMSLVDDILIEKIRKFYCEKFKIEYTEIADNEYNSRAKRITAYLNLVNKIVSDKKKKIIENFDSNQSEIDKYFDLLPNNSVLKAEYNNLKKSDKSTKEKQEWLMLNMVNGSIDVNIMTKIDTDKYINGVKQTLEMRDSFSALRAYAESDLESSLILSAGMNPKLYNYLTYFNDFFPDKSGYIKKKVILKVSDFRSALIQGKFLAKKGIWVSEYRIESGINCGGHAFANDGFLLGPILEEFKENRFALINEINLILKEALSKLNKDVPKVDLDIKITVQGGVGTLEEHNLLLDYYNVDSVGWGSPFLLVEEVTSVDNNTRNLLVDAKEKDLYLSNISPLGVPFNSLRGNSKDIEKQLNIDKGTPGSNCPKKYISINTEFTEIPICVASRQYQKLKIEQLDNENLSEQEYKRKFDNIVEKSCICVGLGTAALLVHNLNTKLEGEGVTICPGPNMAYFSKKLSLLQMVNHIYGRENHIERNDRPNMFLKELNLYIDFLNVMCEESVSLGSSLYDKTIENYKRNLKNGIAYYIKFFTEIKEYFNNGKKNIISEFEKSIEKINLITSIVDNKVEV